MAALTSTFEFPEEVITQIANKVSWTIMSAIRSSTPTDSNDIMGVDQLAEYLGMSKRWVYDRVNGKSIPHMKIVSALKFSKREIDKWLETYHVPATNDPPKTFQASVKNRIQK